MSKRSDTDILTIVITTLMSRLGVTTLALPEQELDASFEKTLTIRGTEDGVRISIREPSEIHEAPARVQ